MELILQNFHSFLDMVHPQFKTLAEATAYNAELTAHATECATYAMLILLLEMLKLLPKMSKLLLHNEAYCAQIEEKKKYWVLFAIDGLTNDQAIFMLGVLAKDKDQFKVFWHLQMTKTCYFVYFLQREYHIARLTSKSSW